MAERPLILLHGYSADGSAFDRWRMVLRAAGWTAEQLCTVSYESLTNDVSVRDIAEGFDKVLRQRVGLADDEPFDVMVHSTGMLVLRAWLTRRGMTAPRRARVKHVIALAPATFGSPLAHKGRSFLGALVKGRKQLGPDFLEAGDQVLDALELGSRFGWELSHADLFGTECFYDSKRTTPYVFVFCGARGYRGLAALANSPGTDGTVRWAGCALNSRKIILDLSADCAEDARVQTVAWTQDDVPMHPIANVDHGSILAAPPPALQQMVIDALRVSSRPSYAAWCERAEAVVRATREAMVPWQQFIVRAVDERGDGIRDWNLQLGLRDGTTLYPFTQDVHVYGGDPSYRSFHVNLSQLKESTLLRGRGRRLTAQLYASTGTQRVLYTGAMVDAAGDSAVVEAPNRAGTWYGTLDLSSVLPGGAVRFFHPFTTTFIELRLDREPLTGPGMVVRMHEPDQ
jgi:hypothetical protein